MKFPFLRIKGHSSTQPQPLKLTMVWTTTSVPHPMPTKKWPLPKKNLKKKIQTTKRTYEEAPLRTKKNRQRGERTKKHLCERRRIQEEDTDNEANVRGSTITNEEEQTTRRTNEEAPLRTKKNSSRRYRQRGERTKKHHRQRRRIPRPRYDANVRGSTIANEEDTDKQANVRGSTIANDDSINGQQ